MSNVRWTAKSLRALNRFALSVIGAARRKGRRISRNGGSDEGRPGCYVCLLGAMQAVRGTDYDDGIRLWAARETGLTESEVGALEAGFCGWQDNTGAMTSRDVLADRARHPEMYHAGQQVAAKVLGGHTTEATRNE